MLRTLPLIALAAYASAQTLPTISETCTNTLKSIALNSDVAACLNPVALVSLISGNSSTAITPAIDNWLTGLCAAPACSNATITSVVSNVTAGCSTELSTEGVSAENNAQISALIQQYYPTVRSIACLKDGSSFCVTKELQAFETDVGQTLSLDTIAALILNPPTSLSSNVTCTNCVKEAYNIIKKDIPSAASLVDESSITQECGASFIDGSTPSGITQSAVSTVQGTTGSSGGNGALTLSSGAFVTFSSVVSSALFMVLA